MTGKIQPLAPRICPRCQTERSFKILADRIVCRRCGYQHPRRQAARPAQDKPEPTALEDILGEVGIDITGDAQPRPRYQLDRPEEGIGGSMQYSGPVASWTRAAFNTGIAALRHQRWDEAADAFKRVIEQQRDFFDAYYWLARLATDPVEKRGYLEKVVAYQPGHSAAIRELMILDGKLSADEIALLDNPQHQPIRQFVEGAVGTEAEDVRCPACGASSMRVDDVTGLPFCTACGYTARQPGAARGGDVLTHALLKRRARPVEWVVGERLLACGACGAERTINAQTLATHCPFCGSRHVVEHDALATFQQPDGVLPFVVDEAAARAAIHARLGGWLERVRGLLDDTRLAQFEIEGDYLPYWVFDASVSIRRTVIKSGDNMERHTRHHAINAYQTSEFPEAMFGVAVPGVKSPSRHLLNRLDAFDTGSSVGYEATMLSNHSAQIYSVDVDQASLLARERISAHMRRRHGVATRQDEQVNITASVTQMSFQLMLFPVWVATLYERDGDRRTALVHGQNGSVVLSGARRPRDQG
ncbi:MAG: hypothetical protein ACOCYT_04185 [Chloroflexota bacterium]